MTGASGDKHSGTTRDTADEAVGDQVMVDEDGYPTDWGIAQLRGFSGGTPEQFVDTVRQLWWVPSLIDVAPDADRHGSPIVRIRMMTGGWSGNEQVISEIDKTFFSFFFWQSSHRGGLHIYEVPEPAWRADAWVALGALPGAHKD